MKYLQKFNESNDYKNIKDYILMCFGEFADDKKYEFEFEVYEEESYFNSMKKDEYECIIDLLINIPEDLSYFKMEGYCFSLENIINIDIENTLKNIEEIKEFYLDIDSCLKKVKDEYPEINYNIQKDIDNINNKITPYLSIFFNIKKQQ